MFPIDPLWAYIGVPAILVSILVLIKLRLGKMDERVESAFTGEGKEGAQTSEKEATGVSLVEAEEPQAKPESSEETRQQDCPNYLGYLYMRSDHDRTHIPTECYNCRRLLRCLYSPSVVEKVYGE